MTMMMMMRMINNLTKKFKTKSQQKIFLSVITEMYIVAQKQEHDISEKRNRQTMLTSS